MCCAPLLLPDGKLASCRKCWQCAERKVDDWVGRCIAESKTAKASFSVTLTYGRDDQGQVDHMRAAVLTYSDVQKYLKRLRKNGFPCRYFCIGEYGSQKGRSHWHIMLYFRDAVPPHELETRFAEQHWTHGLSFWERPSAKSVRYICKYIQKDIGKAERQGHLAMSKKPPLGDAYFKTVAEQYVRQGLVPQDLFYTFPEAERKDGKPVRFLLTGKSAQNFLGHYLDHWGAVRPGVRPPHSPLIDEYLNSLVVQDWGLALRHENAARKTRAATPDAPPGRGWSEPVYSPVAKAWLSTQADGSRRWYSTNKEGVTEWHAKIRPDPAREAHRKAERYRRATRGE